MMMMKEESCNVTGMGIGVGERYLPTGLGTGRDDQLEYLA